MSMQTSSPAPGAKKILVIDDNQVILKAMSLALTSKGYRVFTAETGAETITVLRHEKPDLILLDLAFPVDSADLGGPFHDGFIIIDWARRVCDAENIPVIILSSLDPEEYKERARKAGILTFFRKPVDNHKLLEAIQTMLIQVPKATPQRA